MQYWTPFNSIFILFPFLNMTSTAPDFSSNKAPPGIPAGLFHDAVDYYELIISLTKDKKDTDVDVNKLARTLDKAIVATVCFRSLLIDI
jgi:hypothetical protein